MVFECICGGKLSAKVVAGREEEEEEKEKEKEKEKAVQVNNFIPDTFQGSAKGESETRVAEDTTKQEEEHKSKLKEKEEGKRRSSAKVRLIKAAKSNDAKSVAEILKAEPSCIDETGMWGNSALLCACQYGAEETALVLLEHGAAVGLANELGCTALHHACLEGMEGVVRAMCVPIGRMVPANKPILFEAAAMYNSRTDEKTALSPLLAAVTNGHANILSILLAERLYNGDAMSKELEQALEISIREGFLNCVKVLFRVRKELVTQVRDKSIYYLVMACTGGKSLEVVSLLLDEDLSVNGCLCGQSDDVHAGPLATTCRRGDMEILTELMQAGADPNYTCGACATPLIQACRSGDVDCVNALLSGGAHCTILDPEVGMTAIEYARQAQLTDILEALQEA